MDFVLALVLAARWIQQPPRPPSPPVVRVQKHRPKRKRVRNVRHRKPPVVWTYPDKIEVMSYAEFWAAERARMKAMAAWYVGLAVK